MTKKIFLSLFLAAMMCVPFTTSAQVTIGSGAAPHSFSVLELMSNQQKGLRLPQMTTADRIEYLAEADLEAYGEAARGLMIFNLTEGCVEVWDGENWTCISRGSAESVIIANAFVEAAGWVIDAQDFRVYGNLATFSVSLRRYSAEPLQVWSNTGNELQIATMNTEALIYAPGTVGNQPGFAKVIRRDANDNLVPVTVNAYISYEDGSLWVMNLLQWIGTILNRGTFQQGDIVTISGTYFVNLAPAAP